MKSWKDVPHMFANGKFLVKRQYKGKREITSVGPLYPTDIEEVKRTPDVFTLIARPIEDMTDEEIINSQADMYQEGDFVEDHRYEILQRANKGLLTAGELVHFLSVGVYPGPQSHFKDGTVINAKEESECK